MALDAPNPVAALRHAVEHLLAGPTTGVSDRQAAVYDSLDELHLRLRAEQDPREDAVLDVMDFLSGWCSPQARIRPAA
jgi:hypothetical protein